MGVVCTQYFVALILQNCDWFEWSRTAKSEKNPSESPKSLYRKRSDLLAMLYRLTSGNFR